MSIDLTNVHAQLFRHFKHDVLFTPADFMHVQATQRFQARDHLLHQHVRCRGAGGNADIARFAQPAFLNIRRRVDQISRFADALRQFRQTVGVEEFFDPTTSTTSASPARLRTAS